MWVLRYICTRSVHLYICTTQVAGTTIHTCPSHGPCPSSCSTSCLVPPPSSLLECSVFHQTRQAERVLRPRRASVLSLSLIHLPNRYPSLQLANRDPLLVHCTALGPVMSTTSGVSKVRLNARLNIRSRLCYPLKEPSSQARGAGDPLKKKNIF